MSIIYFLDVSCDHEKKFFIQSIWDNDNVILNIIDNFSAFKSNASEKILKNLANKYEVNFKQYVEELRCSLSENFNDFIYKRNENIFKILRKRENILVQFADFILEEVAFDITVVQIVNDLYTVNKFHTNKSIQLQEEKEMLEKEKNECIKKLEEYSNKKKDMEHELYSKFILVLNEKKQRIQYLQELLEKFKNEGKCNMEIQQVSEMNGRKQETISDSESETSIDEPAEIITHNVQIEHSISEKETKKKINILEEVEDVITFKNLPKRAKIIDNSSDTINTVIEPFKSDENNISIKGIASELNKEDSQESLNFDTEDLLDRL